MLETVGDGVFLVDQDGIVRLWNHAAETITGSSRHDLVGRRLEDVLPGLERVTAGAETLPLELAGRERWLSVSSVSFDEGTVYAFRDITEERALEDMRQDLVATVSHELRTPLAAIFGSAVTLTRRDVTFDEQRWFELDPTYQIMRVLGFLGIIDMTGTQVARPPSAAARLAG